MAGSVTASTDVEPATRPAPAASTAADTAAVYDQADDRAEVLALQRAARAQRASAAAGRAAASSPPAATAVRKPAKVAAAAPKKKAAPARKQRAETTVAAPSGSAAAVVAFARAQVGKKYVFGTTGPNTFDCSGLVVAAYRRIGINLPHQTGGLSGRGRAVSRAQLQPGDLVFPHAGHVGIYVGGGQMVHASTPRGGVKLGPIYRFSYARRIL